MVRLVVLFTASLAAFAGLATAGNCKKGLKYCGNALLHRGGNYYSDVIAELQQHEQSTDPANVKDSLFNCGHAGSIGFDQYCGDGCQDGGSGKSDFCG